MRRSFHKRIRPLTELESKLSPSNLVFTILQLSWDADVAIGEERC